MKKEFLPYYISRAILSATFAILIMGFSWKAVLMTVVFFGLFLLYLHSGWFSIDLRNPLMPLRRDSQGQLIQRKALIISVVVSLLIYLTSLQLSSYLGLSLISGSVAFSIGVITYFIAQFVLFAKA
jgi:uncharacterized membrane protein